MKAQYIPNHQDHCMSSQQVQHLYACLSRDIPFNPAQADQFIQIQEPDLPDFLHHLDKGEDPVPCFTMTNPYEASPPMIQPEAVCMSPLICYTLSNH